MNRRGNLDGGKDHGSLRETFHVRFAAEIPSTGCADEGNAASAATHCQCFNKDRT